MGGKHQRSKEAPDLRPPSFNVYTQAAGDVRLHHNKLQQCRCKSLAASVQTLKLEGPEPEVLGQDVQNQEWTGVKKERRVLELQVPNPGTL